MRFVLCRTHRPLGGCALGAVLAAAVLLTGCGGSQAAPDDAVAVFDGGWVTADEVARAAEGSATRPSRIASRREQGPDEVARWLAWEKLVAAERRVEVESRREWTLRAQQLEREALAARLRAELEAAVEVSEQEIESEIEAIRASRQANWPRIEIRHIFLRASDDLPGAERQRKLALAQRLLSELRRGADFEELARTHSDSKTAANGGLIPGIRPGMTDPEFERVVFALDEGEVSDVITTASGYHIVRLESRSAPETFDEDGLRARLPDLLRRGEAERAVEELVERLEQTEPVVARWSDDGAIDPRSADGAILELGDFLFTADDLRRVRSESGAALQRPDQITAYLDRLLERELLYREALRRFDPPRRQIDEAAQRAREIARIELALRDQEEELIQSIPVEELNEFVAEHGIELQRSTTYRPQVIYIPDGANVWETFREVEAMVAELRGGADFGELARQRSRGPKWDSGGDLGYLTGSEMLGYEMELARAVVDMDVGATSDPIRIPENRLSSQAGALEPGFLIVKLAERHEARPIDLATDEDEIRDRYWAAHRLELLMRNRDEALLAANFALLAAQTPTSSDGQPAESQP